MTELVCANLLTCATMLCVRLHQRIVLVATARKGPTRSPEKEGCARNLLSLAY